MKYTIYKEYFANFFIKTRENKIKNEARNPFPDHHLDSVCFKLSALKF